MLRRHARRVGVFIVGWLIVIAGLALVPLPGPGWAIVFVGLSLLATEFEWARRLKNWVQAKLTASLAWIQAKRARRRARRTGCDPEQIADIRPNVEEIARGDQSNDRSAVR